MYEGPVRRSGGVATPPGPPSRLTLERLTTRSSPLTSHGRALTSGPLYTVVSGRPSGTPGSNIRAKPTATSTPCRPDASVSPLQVPAAAPSVRGGTPRTRVPGVCNCHNTSRLVRGRLRKIWRHVLAPGGRSHSRRHAKSNPRRGKCSDTSPPPKTMKNYHQSYSTCAHIV